jgi:hypothetical protein
MRVALDRLPDGPASDDDDMALYDLFVQKGGGAAL